MRACAAVLAKYGLEPPEELYQAVGCSHCRGKGYRERIGVFEVAIADDEIRTEIAKGATEHELREQIRSAGTPELTADALSKACHGLTSLDEAIRMHSV